MFRGLEGKIWPMAWRLVIYALPVFLASIVRDSLNRTAPANLDDLRATLRDAVLIGMAWACCARRRSCRGALALLLVSSTAVLAIRVAGVLDDCWRYREIFMNVRSSSGPRLDEPDWQERMISWALHRVTSRPALVGMALQAFGLWLGCFRARPVVAAICLGLLAGCANVWFQHSFPLLGHVAFGVGDLAFPLTIVVLVPILASIPIRRIRMRLVRLSS